MHHIRNVQGLNAPERAQGVICYKEQDGGQNHSEHDQPGGGSAYVDAIPNESQGGKGRHNPEPDQKRYGRIHNTRFVCHQHHHLLAKGNVNHGRRNGNPQAPAENHPHRQPEPNAIPRPDILSGKRLPGKGKSIDEEREKHQELHDYGADSQHGISIIHRQGRKAHVDEKEAHAPHKQVAVHREESAHILYPQRFPKVRISEEPAIVNQEQRHTQQKPCVLGREHRPGNALEPHPQFDGKQKAQQEVGHVHKDIRRHGTYGVLHADEKSLEHEQAQRCRRCPDPDEIVLARQSSHLIRAMNESQSNVYIKVLNGKDEQRYSQSRAYSLGENLHHRGKVPAAQSLRHHSSGSNAQEAQIPVEQIEKHGGNGHAANGYGIPDMAAHANVHHPNQRNGDIGQDARKRKPEHPPIHLFKRLIHRPRGTCRRTPA